MIIDFSEIMGDNNEIFKVIKEQNSQYSISSENILKNEGKLNHFQINKS